MAKRYPVPNPGSLFNKLRVLGISANKTKDGRKLVSCQCLCGNTKDVQIKELHTGHVKSCGCLHYTQKNLSASFQKEYDAWRGMQRRCYDTDSPYYQDYGGRGIEVCEQWLVSFETFLTDVGVAPDSTHSLDRIDSDGNYELSNVRWATPTEQARNRRISENCIIYRFEHKNSNQVFVGTRYEFADRYNVDLNALASALRGSRRFADKWSVTCVLTEGKNG